jgi:hypothetical protein
MAKAKKKKGLQTSSVMVGLWSGAGRSILISCDLHGFKGWFQSSAGSGQRHSGMACPVAAPFAKTGHMRPCVKLASAALHNPSTDV